MQNFNLTTNINAKTEIPDWKTITKYHLINMSTSQNVEQLQSFVHKIYDINITKEDFEQKTPFTLYNLVQILQLSLSYFQYCKQQLDQSSDQINQLKQKKDKEIAKKEHRLKKEKQKIQNKYSDLRVENQALKTYKEKMRNAKYFACYYCHQKYFDKEEHWTSHMNRKHQEVMQPSKSKAMSQVMSNVILQQQLNNLFENNLQKKYLLDQFVLLERNKQLAFEEYQTQKGVEKEINEQLSNLQREYDQKTIEVIHAHQEKMKELISQNKIQFFQNSKKIDKQNQEFRKKIIEQEGEMQKAINNELYNVGYFDQEKEAQSQHKRHSMKRFSLGLARLSRPNPNQDVLKFDSSRNYDIDSEDDEEVKNKNEKNLQWKDFELQIQKYRTLAMNIQMNRNLGVKPEFLKEDKESIRANLNEYINRCLIEWQDLNLYELEKKDNVNKQEVEYILLENIGAIDVQSIRRKSQFRQELKIRVAQIKCIVRFKTYNLFRGLIEDEANKQQSQQQSKSQSQSQSSEDSDEEQDQNEEQQAESSEQMPIVQKYFFRQENKIIKTVKIEE